MRQAVILLAVLIIKGCAPPDQTAGGRAAPSPNAFIKGLAVYQSGDPAGGAGVYLRDAAQVAPASSGTAFELPLMQTDMNGCFGFCLPRHGEYVLETADSAGLSHVVQVGPDDLREDTVALYPVLTAPGAVAGTVSRPDTGLAFTLFRVSLRGMWVSTVPDSNGFFLLAGVPAGEFILRIDAPYMTGHMVIQIEERPGIEVTSAETTEVGTVRVKARSDLPADSLYRNDSLIIRSVLDLNGAAGPFEAYTAVLNGRIAVFSDENGEIDTLPPVIGNLDALEVLILHNGGLSSVPAELAHCHSLIRLDLVNQKLSAVPACISEITSLVELNMIGNAIGTLPDGLTGLTSVQYLSIRDNQITVLPDDIDDLLLLKTLDLSRNQLSALPGSITNLEFLQNITLGNNNICSLPDSITAWLDARQHDWLGSQCP